MAKDTKERILTEGVDLLSRGGFAGVTLGLLAQQTGMSKSGLFAHFKSKDEAQLELLEKMTRLGFKSSVEPSMKSRQGLARLRAVFRGWLGWTERAGLHGGCPVAAGMFELDDAPESDPVRQRLILMEAGWREQLAQMVHQAIDSGELRRDLDVDQFVWEMCGIYLNHHASHRFIRDPQALHRAKKAFESLIARSRALPKAGSTSARCQGRIFIKCSGARWVIVDRTASVAPHVAIRQQGGGNHLFAIAVGVRSRLQSFSAPKDAVCCPEFLREIASQRGSLHFAF